MLLEAQENNKVITAPDFDNESNELYSWNEILLDKKEAQKLIMKMMKHSSYAKFFCEVSLEAFEKWAKSKKRRRNKKPLDENQNLLSKTSTRDKENFENDCENHILKVLAEKKVKGDDKMDENYETIEKNEMEHVNMTAFYMSLNELFADENTFQENGFQNEINEKFRVISDEEWSQAKKKYLNDFRFLPQTTRVLFKLHQIVVETFPDLQSDLNISKLTLESS